MKIRHRQRSTAAGTGAAVFWHESAPDPPPSQPLVGLTRADVAVVGGGFTGLWTAIHLKEAEPDLDVVVLEAGTVAHGASGRNGGFAMCLLDFSLAHLHRRFGTDGARAAHLAVENTIDEMAEQISRYGIDCDWVKGGLLMVATNPGQQERLHADLDAAAAMGLTDTIRHVEREELRGRVHSPTYLEGVWEQGCAVLHPTKLVRGLARAAVRAGVRLHQGTPALAIEDDGTIVTPHGRVAAGQVVLATNAWAHEAPAVGRRVRPLYTYVLLTEPLSDAQWERVGWAGCEGIEDKRNYVHYYRRTADGRILWGGTDALDHGGRIDPRLDASPHVRAALERTFHRTFPQLADVRFTHHWGGPIGITVTFVPLFGTSVGGRVHYGVGYNGHGVAPSHLGGKILRDKVLGRHSELLALPFVDAHEPTFPPEPLMSIGSALTRRALLRQDRRLDAGRREGMTDPPLLRILEKLG
jgi:glycine/D-amino acid oxidase-like deaminating enzyme